MKKHKLIAIVMAVVASFSAICAGGIALGDTLKVSASDPIITLTATSTVLEDVTPTEWTGELELGISVGSGSFQSLGLVLAYDKTKITPSIGGWTDSTVGAAEPEFGWSNVDGWSGAVTGEVRVVPTYKSQWVSEGAAIAYEPVGESVGYLYVHVGTETKSEPHGSLLMTVLFDYAEDTAPIDTNTTVTVGAMQDGENAIWLCASEDVLEQSRNLHGIVYYTGEGDTFFYYNYNSEALGGESAPVDTTLGVGTNLVFENKSMGKSIFSGGGAGVDDIVGITFYDWDGTLLGTRFVVKGSSLTGDHDSPEGRGGGKTQAPMPPEGNTLTYGDVSVVNKAGYTFAGWVDYETGYSVPNVLASVGAGQTIPIAAKVSLTNIQESMVLKAAYDETGIGANPPQRQYSISYTPFKTVGTVLETKITVRRPATGRRAVEGELFIKIVLAPKGAGQTAVLIPVGKSDIETITFQMPNTAALNYATNALIISAVDVEGTVRSGNTTIQASAIVNH